MSEVGKQNKEKKGKATLTVLALHTHKHCLAPTTFRYQSTEEEKREEKKKRRKKKSYGIIYLISTNNL